LAKIASPALKAGSSVHSAPGDGSGKAALLVAYATRYDVQG
jgi:hypothetical protein